MSLRSFAAILSAACLTCSAATSDAADADYHHVHLAATNAQEAADWYIEHMGCEDFGRAGACQVGQVQLIFAERDPQGGSVSSGIDHIGFSFQDLSAKMTGWKAAGLNVLDDIREVDGVIQARVR